MTELREHADVGTLAMVGPDRDGISPYWSTHFAAADAGSALATPLD